MMASSVRQSWAVNATSSRSDTATSFVRESPGGRVAVAVPPMSRDNALQIRLITPRESDQSTMDVDDDADGARGGNAKTNMADSMLILINTERLHLLNRDGPLLAGVIRGNSGRGRRKR